MKTNIIPCCSLLVAAILATGCSRQPTVPPAEFGETVRRVMERQIHDYEAAIHPKPDAVEGGDPYRLDAALNAYRNIEQSQPAQAPININVGSQN